MPDTKTITIRMPAPLLHHIATIALAEDRSVSNQIVQLLKLALQEMEAGK